MARVAPHRMAGMGQGTRHWPLWRRVAVLVFAGLSAVVLYYALVSDAPLPDPRFLRGFNDLALHFGAFLAISASALLIWPRPWRVALVLAGVAVLTEIAQIVTPHEVSAFDIVAGWAGVALGTAVAMAARLAWGRLTGHGAP